AASNPRAFWSASGGRRTSATSASIAFRPMAKSSSSNCSPNVKPSVLLSMASSRSRVMELVERYLQAVKFWLPGEKQDDIIAELRDDIRSEIDEQEAALGHPLDKGELEALLKRRGPPVLVAERFLPQRHLIGPMWFPIYWFVLRLAVAFNAVPWLVVWLILVLNSPAYRAAHPGIVLYGTLSTLWTSVLVQFAVITVIFAALDRSHSREKFIENWKVSHLPRLKKDPTRVSRGESAFNLAVNGIFLYWLLSLPAWPWMAFGPAAALFHLNAALHVYYAPLVLFVLIGVVQAVLNLWRPEWTWLPPATGLATSIGGLLVLNSAMKIYPYVSLLDPAANSARYGHVAYGLNIIVLLSLGCVWLGLAIACGVHAIQCFGHLRRWIKRSDGASPVLPGGVAGLPEGRS